MRSILTVMAVILTLAGFVGFFFGVIPTIIAWVLAALCIVGVWKLRPPISGDHGRELNGPPAA